MFLKLTGGLDCVCGEVSLDLTPYANDPAAGEFLRAMRDGKWRKARDAAKSLCKQDRPRYLPLLVEANAGLARGLIAKGLLKDAVTVIEYLATIAPPEMVAKLRGELACPTSSAADQPAGGGTIHWAVALRAADGQAAQIPISPEDMAAIDALVTHGFSPPQGAGEAADILAAELVAVREACAATGDGRWDEAKDALRALPRDSIFRHWRMFLRGARHAFGEELEMARKCFADLPPVGALARAARALDPDLPGRGPAAPVGARVPFFLAATGQPAAWSTAILDAEASGKAGKTVRAYKDLSTVMKGAFPDDRPGLAALLTGSVMPFSRNMREADIDDAYDLLDAYSGGKLADSPNAILTVVRGACLAIPDYNAPGELERTWGTVLSAWSRRDGSDLQRDAVGWQWLGETQARLEEQDYNSSSRWGSSPRGDFRRARTAFEKSVKADPENQDAWLALLAVLKKSGDTKEHNRILGELVGRFPKNKKILLLAGNEALARKTYPKALKALRAALELDPLDREIKCSISIALVRQAIDLLKKKKSATAVWDELEPLLEDKPGTSHLMLSRWIARLRIGLLEIDPEAAATAMAAAEKLAPSAVERLFLEEKLREAYRLTKRKTLDTDWRREVLKRPPGWEAFARLFQLAEFSGLISPWSIASWNRSVKNLDVLVSAMIENATDKDLADLADFLERAERLTNALDKDSRDLLRQALRSILKRVEIVIDSKKQPRPWLHLANLLALEASGAFMGISQTMFYGRLDQIIAMTEKSGDPTCLAKARALHDRMTSKYREPDSFDDDESSPPSLLDMLADAMNSMDVGADDIHGNSAKGSAKKPASKKPASGDQMDFLL